MSNGNGSDSTPEKVTRLFVTEYEETKKWTNGGKRSILNKIEDGDLYLIFKSGKGMIPPPSCIGIIDEMKNHKLLIDCEELSDSDYRQMILQTALKYSDNDTSIFFLSMEEIYLELREFFDENMDIRSAVAFNMLGRKDSRQKKNLVMSTGQKNKGGSKDKKKTGDGTVSSDVFDAVAGIVSDNIIPDIAISQGNIPPVPVKSDVDIIKERIQAERTSKKSHEMPAGNGVKTPSPVEYDIPNILDEDKPYAKDQKTDYDENGENVDNGRKDNMNHTDKNNAKKTPHPDKTWEERTKKDAGDKDKEKEDKEKENEKKEEGKAPRPSYRAASDRPNPMAGGMHQSERAVTGDMGTGGTDSGSGNPNDRGNGMGMGGRPSSVTGRPVGNNGQQRGGGRGRQPSQPAPPNNMSLQEIEKLIFTSKVETETFDKVYTDTDVAKMNLIEELTKRFISKANTLSPNLASYNMSYGMYVKLISVIAKSSDYADFVKSWDVMESSMPLGLTEPAYKILYKGARHYAEECRHLYDDDPFI